APRWRDRRLLQGIRRAPARRTRSVGRPRFVPRRCRCHMTSTPRRGELWWCELPDIGRRPVVVLSRDVAIPRLRRTLVAPCTTTVRGLPSEVVLEPSDDPVSRRCAANLDSVESVSVTVLVERSGRLSDERMRQVCAALEVAVDSAPTRPRRSA